MSTVSKGARVDRGEEVVITQKMYGWSKHGGVRYGLAKETLDVWVCQICAEKQSRDMPSWMLSIDEDMREYVRVCSKCKRASLELHYEEALENFRSLMKEVRRLRRRRVENLLRHIQ